MEKARITEIFYSLQGEGKFTGTPSIFIRFFGCNFKCEGFGMPRGKKSLARFDVDPTKYSSVQELPLVKTGCDSYAAWDPRFRHLSEEMTVDQVCSKIMDLYPNENYEGIHIVLTGGEPLLPNTQKFVAELCGCNFFTDNEVVVTIETNGTQPISEELDDIIICDYDEEDFIFSISPKLPCSGAPWDKAIQNEIVTSYFMLSANSYLKFVVATEEDVADVELAIEEYKKAQYFNHNPLDIYLMPVGGTAEGYELNKSAVADLALSKGWRFSDRLQCSIWRNAWSK